MKLNYLFSTFTYSTSLELLVTELEKAGVPAANILAVPLERMGDFQTVFDTDLSDDGKSLLDLAAVLGAVFMLLGVIYGLSFYWGPVIWGLIGLVCGIALGFVMEYLYKTKRKKCSFKKEEREFMIIVHHPDSMTEAVFQIIRSHSPKGIGKLKKDD
ncbi:hypothetical protein CEF21_09765 [Bacillus sp. FJAT-42376]|uniref:hypothetical protein n=1 Tax=Bacillus sp. FJAT-42376 TaxID=2014076 RepID=UPI000F4FECC4|nr:hypothetical protein [Bacillus sp. FJAT-42376]AZB42549.1 hypothetical protein CEF21_09765 [Bacillus sp. FJAT-42376]